MEVIGHDPFKTGRETIERTFVEPIEKASGCASREGRCRKSQEFMQVRVRCTLGPTGNVNEVRFTLAAPGGNRPLEAPPSNRHVKVAKILARRYQLVANPLGNGYAHGISDELPSRAVLSSRHGSDAGPVSRETLESLGIPNLRSHDVLSEGQHDGRRRRNSYSRPTLERRHGIDGGAEAAKSFGPIKTECQGCILFPYAFGNAGPKQYGPWILASRRYQNDPESALGKSERARVDDAVRPGESARLEFGDENGHRLSTIQMKHERYVLEDNPLQFFRHPRSIDQSEDVVDQTGVLAANPGRSAGLTEILARKSASDDFDFWKRPQRANVAVLRNVREMFSKNGLGRRIDLT